MMHDRSFGSGALIVLLTGLIALLVAAMVPSRAGSPGRLSTGASVESASASSPTPACKPCKGERPDFEELAHFSPACNDARRVLHELEHLDRPWAEGEMDELRSLIDDPLAMFPAIAGDEVVMLSSLSVRMIGRRLNARLDPAERDGPGSRLTDLLLSGLDHPADQVRYNTLEAALGAGVADEIPPALLDSALVAIEQSIGATLTHGLRSRLAAGMGRE